MSPEPKSGWSEAKQALQRAGFRPSKRLGQNFLIDANMARAIARDGGAGEGQWILEVGPGCGALTRELLALGSEVLAVEIDGRLIEVLRDQLGAPEKLEVLHCDALESKQRLAPALLERLPRAREWRLVANLPYSAGTPILIGLSRLERRPSTLTALLQRELAERLAARPGSKDWGGVTLKLQACYDVEIVRRVPASLFWPAPDVESAVVRMKLRTCVPSAGELGRFDKLVDVLFQGRRKTLGRLLTDALGARDRALELIAACGLDASVRPEVLSTRKLLELSAQPLWTAASSPLAGPRA